MRLEAEVKHAIGLVQHHVGHGGRLEGAGLHQVVQAARCGHSDLDAFGHGGHLLAPVTTAVDAHAVKQSPSKRRRITNKETKSEVMKRSRR